MGEGGSGNRKVDGSGGICRILKENMIDPSANSEVSGKLEKALHTTNQINSLFFVSALSITYTFSFSPGPHLRPMICLSTTGPLSKSKLQTTISFIHLSIRPLTWGVISGGGLGSPGRRVYPNRSVAERGDFADVFVLRDDSFLCVLRERLRCTLSFLFPLLVRREEIDDLSEGPENGVGDGEGGLAELGREGPAWDSELWSGLEVDIRA